MANARRRRLRRRVAPDTVSDRDPFVTDQQALLRVFSDYARRVVSAARPRHTWGTSGLSRPAGLPRTVTVVHTPWRGRVRARSLLLEGCCSPAEPRLVHRGARLRLHPRRRGGWLLAVSHRDHLPVGVLTRCCHQVSPWPPGEYADRSSCRPLSIRDRAATHRDTRVSTSTPQGILPV